MLGAQDRTPVPFSFGGSDLLVRCSRWYICMGGGNPSFWGLVFGLFVSRSASVLRNNCVRSRSFWYFVVIGEDFFLPHRTDIFTASLNKDCFHCKVYSPPFRGFLRLAGFYHGSLIHMTFVWDYRTVATNNLTSRIRKKWASVLARHATPLRQRRSRSALSGRW